MAPKAVEGQRTPWGRAQEAKELALGIIEFHTATHGGYWISPERRKEMTAKIGEVTTWVGGDWFEEDSDSRYVMEVWPELFPWLRR